MKKFLKAMIVAIDAQYPALQLSAWVSNLHPVVNAAYINNNLSFKKRLRVIMNKNAAIVFILASLLALSKDTDAQSQSFSFTQYMDNLTPLNPAYSMLDKAGSINTMARKQFVGIEGAPTTLLINANLPIDEIDGAAGLFLTNDKIAIERQTEVNAYFAKSVQLGVEDYLAVSINAGIRNYAANYSSLGYVDPEFANDVHESRPNIGFGVMYYTDYYYVGVSVPQLTIRGLGQASAQSNADFINHYYFTGAFLTDMSEDMTLKPSVLVAYAKGQPISANFSGIVYMKETLGIGLNYGTNKQAAGILTINLDQVHIGYGYQFGTSGSNLGGFNAATHEVTLAYRFGSDLERKKLL